MSLTLTKNSLQSHLPEVLIQLIAEYAFPGQLWYAKGIFEWPFPEELPLYLEELVTYLPKEAVHQLLISDVLPLTNENYLSLVRISLTNNNLPMTEEILQDSVKKRRIPAFLPGSEILLWELVTYQQTAVIILFLTYIEFPTQFLRSLLKVGELDLAALLIKRIPGLCYDKWDGYDLCCSEVPPKALELYFRDMQVQESRTGGYYQAVHYSLWGAIKSDNVALAHLSLKELRRIRKLRPVQWIIDKVIHSEAAKVAQLCWDEKYFSREETLETAAVNLDVKWVNILRTQNVRVPGLKDRIHQVIDHSDFLKEEVLNALLD